MKAVAAEPVTLDQGDLGLERSRDVGRDESGRPATHHDDVAIEARGPFPARVNPACTHRVDELLRDERKDAEQRERPEDRWRNDARERLDARELRAGVHVDDRAGEHAELADPVEGERLDRRQAHREVDDEKREHRHQAQRKKVEAPLARDPGIERSETLAEARLNPVAQQPARREEGERGAEARRKRDDQQAPSEPEDRAAGERHHRRAGQRKRGDDDIEREEERGREQWPRLAPGLQRRLAGLDRIEAQVLPEVKREIQADEHEQREGPPPSFVQLFGQSHRACSVLACATFAGLAIKARRPADSYRHCRGRPVSAFVRPWSGRATQQHEGSNRLSV